MSCTGESSVILALGLLGVLAVLILWWRDVVWEARVDKAHTPQVAFGLQAGMILFIVSEVMFFVAFFWAYFHNAFDLSPVLEGVWPPEEIETAHPFGLPLVNTIILVTSGLTLMWGKKGLDLGQRTRLIVGLVLSIALGILFFRTTKRGNTACCLLTSRGEFFPSTFYMATGFHGFHVFIGVCLLSVMLGRALLGHFDAGCRHLGFQFAEWYWHFVDIVWIFLFVFMYWWVAP